MKLSIIIVNYKTPALLLDCLRSVFEYDTTSTEIIVADNDSNDGSEALLQQHFPTVKFIQLGYNSGFARANNAGIKIATGDAILLLNSDTLNIDDAINACFRRLVASPYIAAGVQLLNADGSPQISGNYVMKGGLNYLLPLPYLGRVLRAIAFSLKMQKPNVPEATGLVEVDWINGAFLMVKRAAIDKAGLLDEDFFLFSEESEWCSRLKTTGPLCIYGDLHVTHLQGESSGAAFNSSGKGYFNLFDKKGLQIMLSIFVRLRKQFGIAWFSLVLCVYLFEIIFFLPCMLLENLIRQSRSAYAFQQWLAYTRNVFRILGFVPRIIANKPFFYKVL